MYIAPNTTVRILHNCPLDNSYEHTILFDTPEEQLSYFTGLTKFAMEKMSYQRYGDGVMLVKASADSLYDCNYLMFQNTAFGQKWFYAFIKEIRYENNGAARIEYEIDVMQTWRFDYEMKECFVEREHSETDNIGDNLVPERLDIGEYFMCETTPISPDPQLAIVVMYAPTKITDIASEFLPYILTEDVYSGVYQGLHFAVLPQNENNVDMLKRWLNVATVASSDGIIKIFTIPYWGAPPKETTLTNRMINVSTSRFVARYEGDFGVSGWKPKNSKLYTYPYSCIYATNNSGSDRFYKYENFDLPDDDSDFETPDEGGASSSKVCMFGYECSFGAQPAVICYPRGYQGLAFNYTECVEVSNFPCVSWSNTNFVDWLANDALQQGIKIAGNAVMIGAGVSTGNPLLLAQGAMGLEAGVTNAMQSYTERGIGSTVKGVANSGVMSGTINGNTISLYRVRIRGDYAKRIDEYFSMYGYATKAVKIPNRSSRPKWNYVKTIGTNIVGSIPCDDMRAICNIYERGITFWKNGNEIGDYSLDNSPQSEV